MRGAIGGRFVSLDDEEYLSAALRDPGGFVEGDDLLVIDEFQRGGDPLLLAIKSEVDRDRRPGRFLLTGSTRFLAVPNLSESLAGRVDIVDLWPLSQGEIRGTRESFVDRALGPTAPLRRLRPGRLSRERVFGLVCGGGFPEAVLRGGAARRRWFNAYVKTVIERDALEVARVHEGGHLPRLARLLAAGTASELNLSGLARDLGIPRTTLAGHLLLLESVFLFHSLPAWSRNLTSKVVKGARVHLVDSGLAAHLLAQTPASLLRPVSRAAGPLLETFVAGEIARQATWAGTPADLLHFRDRAGQEIDLVLEGRDGRLAAIEVKAARSLQIRDFKHLEWIRERVGEDFANGIVLYAGESPLSFGDRMTALPVSALWAD